jgi:hypothetical protein
LILAHSLVRPASIFLYPTEISPVSLWAQCTRPNSGPPGSSSSSGRRPSHRPRLASPLRPPPMDALPPPYGAEPTRHQLLFNFPMNHHCPVVSPSSNRCLDSAPPAVASPTVSPPHPYKMCPRLRLSTLRSLLPAFPHLHTSSALSSRNSDRHLGPPSPSHPNPSVISCQPR